MMDGNEQTIEPNVMMMITKEDQNKMTRGAPEVRSDKSLTLWTNGPMDQWTNGPIDQWTNGPMDQWTDGPMDQWTNGPMDQWTKGPMDQ